MSETTTRPEPHPYVPAEPGTRDAEFGWCAVDGCGHSADAYIHASEADRRAFDSGEGARDAHALAQDREWFGYLTIANYAHVAERIRRLLAGKKYTWVAVVSWPPTGYIGAPEVRIGQEMESLRPTTSELEDGRTMAHISVSDSYGVWGIDSTHATQHDARADKADRRVYLHFEGDRWGNRLTIEHYSASGNHLWWTVAVEGSGW